MKKKSTQDAGEEERMTTVEVARYIGISYQTAYNRILSGVYGPSDYNAATRTMSVRARTVRKAKHASDPRGKRVGAT